VSPALRPPCVILNEPQLAENIGAVARVMANFGLSDLRLIRPRDGWPQERAWASASGADWPLDEARVFGRIEDAVADLRCSTPPPPGRGKPSSR
jgi:tRNA/rRNA methyltransferase